MPLINHKDDPTNFPHLQFVWASHPNAEMIATARPTIATTTDDWYTRCYYDCYRH